jgi:hypothetical protein
MHTPSAHELLDVWEAAEGLPPVERALALLMVARPDLSHQTLAELPIGRRDAELLSLRERLFGSSIVALVSCPQCRDRCELTFQTSDIDTAAPTDAMVEVREREYAVRARPVNSLDLMNLPLTRGVAAQTRAIMAHCTIEARRGETSVTVDDLPDDVMDVVAQAMSAADPHADIHVTVECQTCGHRWPALFDVTAFIWREIDAWANRLLEEVHTLAGVYGWTEREILSMSASRRRRYVSMVVGA